MERLEVKWCPEGFSVNSDFKKAKILLRKKKALGKLNGALGFGEATVEGNGSLFPMRKSVYNDEWRSSSSRLGMGHKLRPCAHGLKDRNQFYPLSVQSHWFWLGFKKQTVVPELACVCGSTRICFVTPAHGEISQLESMTPLLFCCFTPTIFQSPAYPKQLPKEGSCFIQNQDERHWPSLSHTLITRFWVIIYKLFCLPSCQEKKKACFPDLILPLACFEMPGCAVMWLGT